MQSIIVLGISAFYHDSAAAIIRDGVIIAAASEERFSRIKGDNSFPIHAIDFCLCECGIDIQAVTHIVYYEEPVLKFERIILGLSFTIPHSFRQFLPAVSKQITNSIWIERTIQQKLGVKKKIEFCPHHISHAASAFLPSPFQKAAIMTFDSVGEWMTASLGIGNANKFEIKEKMDYPNSLGLLYSAFTFYCGFKINSGEYKLMGLAPYGKPVFADLIKEELININDDGSIIINQKYFSYTFGLKTINSQFEQLFGQPKREPEGEITEHYMDIAASIQEVTNEIIIKSAKHLKELSGCDNLVMSGGVALNITANGQLLRSNIFKNIWVQPASGDAGGALGCALHYYYCVLDNPRVTTDNDMMHGALLGPSISIPDNTCDELEEYQYTVLTADNAAQSIAALLADGKAVAIARGKMEFGPRALGNRSILCDAQNPETQKNLNINIKFREDFRPFAPIVRWDDAKQYFEIEHKSPYMLFSFWVNKNRCKPFEKTSDILKTVSAVRSDITAVTHVDYSARVQTVSEDDNPFIYDVLTNYKELTGCGVLVNTSFNVRGEPIVCTSEDAIKCFLKTKLDYALIDNRLYSKEKRTMS